jgi:hypothetical protein
VVTWPHTLTVAQCCSRFLSAAFVTVYDAMSDLTTWKSGFVGTNGPLSERSVLLELYWRFDDCCADMFPGTAEDKIQW